MHTWTGAVNGSWSVPGNWVGDFPPVNGETGANFVFPNGQGNMGAMVNDVTGLGVSTIHFQDTAYDVIGNGIALNGAIWVEGGTAFAFATIRFPIALSGTGAFVSVATSNCYLEVAGPISGNQNVLASSVSGQGGEIRLSGANTYTGTTTVSWARLHVAHPSALGAGDGTPATGTIVDDGTLALQGVVVPNEALSLAGSGANGNGTIQSNGASPNAWNGPVTLTSNVVFAAIEPPAPLTVNGTISGAFGVTFRTVAGSGVTLTAANLYSGPSTLEYGNVFVNGAQTASACVLQSTGSSPAYLRGTGGVGPISCIAGLQPKFVQPGTDAATGILTCVGGVNLTEPALQSGFVARLNGTTPGTGYDRLVVAGPVTLANAALAVFFGYTPSVGDSYVIVDNDGADAVVGTFSTLPEGSTFVAFGRTLQITYQGGDGNDVVLTVTSLTPVELLGFDAE